MDTFAFAALKKRRWAYLTISLVLLLFLGLIYAWSVFRIPLEKEFGWAKAETSLTFSISMIMFCLGGVASGLITARKGFRLTLFLCAACLLAGFIGASRISSLPGIYITYGGLCGFGVGLGYNAAISVVVKWFPDKQGLASGITLMGFGLGGMILGTWCASLIVTMGWRMMFFILGICFAIIVVLCSLVLRPVTDEFLAMLSAQSKKSATSLAELTTQQMVRQKSFWIYFVYAVIMSAAGLAVINISAQYAGSFLGGDLTQAAAIAGIVSITNGLGRLLSGQIFDTKGYTVTMLTMCVIMLAAGGVLLFSEMTGQLMILVVAFILLGLGYGGVPPINSAFTAYFFGGKHYPLNYSVMNLCILPAAIIGPMCANGSYTMTFSIIIVFAAVSLILALLLKRK